jgi:hypothetical protein
MAGNTNWNNVEPMLAGIALPVMVLPGLLAARTFESTWLWQMLQSDLFIDGISRSPFKWIARSAFFVYASATCFAAITLSIAVFRFLASWRLFVCFFPGYALFGQFISSCYNLAIFRLMIFTHVCSITLFTPSFFVVFTRFVFIKLRQWFFNLAFGADFRYDFRSHFRFPKKRQWSKPVAGTSLRLACLILLAFSVLSTNLFAANEIQMFSPGITTAYYTVRNASGQIWYPTGQVFEAYGTGGRAATDYDLALSDKSAGMWVGDFDTNISTGDYWVASYYQAGGAPADSDPITWTEYGNWTGTVWTGTLTPSTIASSVWGANVADYTDEPTFGGEVGGLDPNITLIKAVTDILQAVNETVASVTDANTFVITHVGDVNDVNDAYNGMTCYLQDATTGDWESRLIIDWETGYEVTVDEPFTFTPEAGDAVIFWATSYFPMDIWDSLPIPLPQPSSTLIDNRATRPSGGVGGTVTINWMGEDP